MGAFETTTENAPITRVVEQDVGPEDVIVGEVVPPNTIEAMVILPSERDHPVIDVEPIEYPNESPPTLCPTGLPMFEPDGETCHGRRAFAAAMVLVAIFSVILVVHSY